MHVLFNSNRELRRDKALPDMQELRPCWRNISNHWPRGVWGEWGRLFEHRPECRRELGRPWDRKSPKAIFGGPSEGPSNEGQCEAKVFSASPHDSFVENIVQQTSRHLVSMDFCFAVFTFAVFRFAQKLFYVYWLRRFRVYTFVPPQQSKMQDCVSIIKTLSFGVTSMDVPKKRMLAWEDVHSGQ